VIPATPHERRLVWAFWIACGLAAVAGIAPLLFGGFSGRIAAAIIPFWIGAVALGACATLYGQGRPIATALYFIAGLAIVYGMLAMLAVPLRLTVVGTCPPAPAQCLAGLEHPLTEGETSGIWFGVGMGFLAIFVGFFGLLTLFRRPGSETAFSPPVRTIPPVETQPAPPPAVDPSGGPSGPSGQLPMDGEELGPAAPETEAKPADTSSE
jgi:hypothetical protein